MRATVLINRGGGALAAGRRIDAEVETALASAGIAGDVEQLGGAELAGKARAAAQRGDPLLIVGGGDGSVSAAAGALAGTATRLGILPLGTLNHFARDLSIPSDLGEAAAVIAAGSERSVDVAEVNGRTFINNAAIGVYPLMVVDRQSQQRRLGRSKWLAVAVASLRTMWNFHAWRLRLSADGGEERVDTPLLFVGNNEYRLALPGAGRRESLEDGRLSVLVMRSKSLPGFIAATARALLGIPRQDDMEHLEGITELRVDSARRRLPLGIDGETVTLETPLRFRIRPRALRVVAPAAAPGSSEA
ncbi:MAG TPA: diacylglycerol kinase family protein [Sphingomicrobium sp.]|nr:diacylglycerol kinase family protein [Sphingomicrobium sp.]